MAQLHLGPTNVRIRPLNSRKLVAVLSSLGKLFHTRADSNPNDLCPYVTVLTVGILTVFSYLKQHFVCLTSTRSLRYSGGMLLIHLYVSVAMHRHIYPSLVLVQPRKTRPCLTERLLMGRRASNQKHLSLFM